MRNLSEIYFLNFYFLNVDISLSMKTPNLTLYRHVKNIVEEGTVSQIFDIGPSSVFTKLRKNIQKNNLKVSRFLT